MNKKKSKPENEENREFNYEDILNEITSDTNESAPKNTAEEGVVLSELLAGIESQDENKTGKKKKQKPKEEETFDINVIPDMNFASLNPDDGAKDSPADIKKDKFEIDLGGMDNSEDIDYASLLNELDKQDINIPATDSSDNVEPASEQTETEGINLDITGESIYDSLISGIDDAQKTDKRESKSSLLSFSLNDLIADEKEQEQPEIPVKEEDLMSDITASYNTLSEDISVIPEQYNNLISPELEGESLPDTTYKVDESDYTSLTGDEDSLKIFDEPSTSMEEELLAGYKTSDQADDSGELKTDEITPLSEDEDILKALDYSETIEIEALDKDYQPSETIALEEPIKEETSQAPTFVIPSMNSDDEEEDFLKLSEDSPQAKQEEDHGLLSGIADVKVAALTEILMPGIEMDPREQTENVTRAEIFLAQGKKKEAAEIYASIARKKGVTPFVAKRLKELV